MCLQPEFPCLSPRGAPFSPFLQWCPASSPGPFLLQWRQGLWRSRACWNFAHVQGSVSLPGRWSVRHLWAGVGTGRAQLTVPSVAPGSAGYSRWVSIGWPDVAAQAAAVSKSPIRYFHTPAPVAMHCKCAPCWPREAVILSPSLRGRYVCARSLGPRPPRLWCLSPPWGLAGVLTL